MQYVRSNPDEIDEYLSVAKAPFVRHHDEARMLLLIAADKDEEFHTRNLCEILGCMIIRDGYERAFGFLQATWYMVGNGDYRRGVEVACHILGINDLDEIRVP